jgi:ankyrin repeat protein
MGCNMLNHTRVLIALLVLGSGVVGCNDGNAVTEVGIAHNGDLRLISLNDQLFRVAAGGFSDADTPKYIADAQQLITSGANVNAHNGTGGETPLFAAVHSNRTRMVKFLLSSGADANARNNVGRTSLHIAGWYGCVEPLRMLVDAGADVNATDDDQKTALHMALLPDRGGLGPALADRIAVVRALVVAGANVAAVDKSGNTPVEMAKEFKDDSLTSIVEEARKRPSPE